VHNSWQLDWLERETASTEGDHSSFQNLALLIGELLIAMRLCSILVLIVEGISDLCNGETAISCIQLKELSRLLAFDNLRSDRFYNSGKIKGIKCHLWVGFEILKFRIFVHFLEFLSNTQKKKR